MQRGEVVVVGNKLIITTVKLPETYIEAMDSLIRMGRYHTRSELIRAAVRQLLTKELWSSGYRPSRKRAKVKAI